MVKVIYQNHNKRKNRAQAFWRQVVKEFNGGRSAQTIADNYINPATGKNYTRAHIYWILKQMREV